MKLKIHLPQKIGLNQYFQKHHYATKAIKDSFYLSTRKDCSGVVTEYPVFITYEYYLVGKLLDWDNTSAMTKMVQDGLVHCGVIKDDSPKYVYGGAQFVKKTDDGTNYVIVTVDK